MGLIHGDFDQFERNDILKKFKNREFPILVATDVAGMTSYFDLCSQYFSLNKFA